MELLDKADTFDVVSILASKAGIESFGVKGDYGLIHGPAADRAVLKHYAACGDWAENSRLLFADFLSGGGTYLDIGANIGLTLIPQARHAGVRCIAFEADPTSFRFLRQNVSANTPSDCEIELHQVALYSHRDTLDFGVSEWNKGDNRLEVSGKPEREAAAHREVIRVEAAPLDSFTIPLADPLAVKIDVQGAEAFVIRGGSRTFAAAGLLAIEFWPYSIRRMECDPQEILDLIADFASGSYSPGDSDEAPRWRPMPEIVAELQAYVGSEDPDLYFDILAKR